VPGKATFAGSGDDVPCPAQLTVPQNEDVESLMTLARMVLVEGWGESLTEVGLQ
jgi:hypothetical protein